MKLISLFLAVTSASAFAQSTNYKNIVRQTQQGTGVVWDMTGVAATGAAASALTLESSGALFQLWTIDQTTAKDYLLDQKLVGAYMPTADVKVITLDNTGITPRTRVDQPFSVEINVAGLLTGTNFPLAASQVLLEQHIASYAAGSTTLNPATVIANTPLYSGYIGANGKTILKFPASSLKATDPTKASGEEYFVVHALSDGTITQTQISSNFVKVWPVASGVIKGISNGDILRFQVPNIELVLNDLYPKSDTRLMLFEGSSINGVAGTMVAAYPWQGDVPKSTVIPSSDVSSKLTKDGTYTLALLSETIYGNELLCKTVTFQVNRTLKVNAMQVNFSNGKTP